MNQQLSQPPAGFLMPRRSWLKGVCHFQQPTRWRAPPPPWQTQQVSPGHWFLLSQLSNGARADAQSQHQLNVCGPDEPSSLVGSLRLGPRDVAPSYWPPLPLGPAPHHPPPIGVLPGPMVHDEENDCFMLGEKLMKKPKRIRTRVDAGEPRNSYSAFSSLPSLCGVSVNAVRPGSAPNLFSASQSFCGLPFVNYLNPPAVGSRGMLSELFGAHTKPVAPCPPEDSAMGVLDKVTSSSVHSADTVNSVIRGPEPDNVLLREILQGRKRELLTMEEIEARSLHNNNNSYKPTVAAGGGGGDSGDSSAGAGQEEPNRESSASGVRRALVEEDSRCDSDIEETMSQSSPRATSPFEEGASDTRKNRLENIVHGIRSSPTPSAAAAAAAAVVNGCKKRKLYQPQQHESRSYDSASEEVEGPEPDQKSRRLEEDTRPEGEVERPSEGEREEGSLQIDLSVGRQDERGDRASPDGPSSEGPHKLPATSSAAPETSEASSYLLDYAQRIIRSQEARLQREQELKSSEFNEKLQLLRNLNANSSVTDLEGLADVLKTEITASLAVIIDSIVNKYVQQRKMLNKQAEVAAEQINRDIASQLMERSRSPRAKMLERASQGNVGPRFNGVPAPHGPLNLSPYPASDNINSLNLPHLRPQIYKPPQGFFPGSLPPVSGVPLGQTSPYGALAPEPEQDEALSLVVTPKKKRHKVTDSRITPRTVGRLLEDMPRYPGLPPTSVSAAVAFSNGGMSGSTSPRSSPPLGPRQYPQPPPLLPVPLPTSVAIPNPSLHETGLLYPPYYRNASSPGDHHSRREESSPAAPHPLLHPALLAASSPDSFSHFLRGASDPDRAGDCSPADTHYDSVQPTISFYAEQYHKDFAGNSPYHNHNNNNNNNNNLLFPAHSSTLTPMHLRKAKLMFFFVRYPSSSVLKTYFPDIKFNKNNTAQLVKWFSNFREFYYIQMEKYARQALSEGIKNSEDITVSMDSELIRVLNLHYNRNNHLEVNEIPEHFRYVVECTLREFFKSLQEGKDTEQSWKKAIYKIIARLDESVPEYFKSPSFLEQLE
ncbi:homeobox protein prospero isoform X4 [Oratosquilla oratoria]|uniref:homeobox protein prospero isoform X4 n=1 Tax=Oratosquilla oratoria TaxID=337810 RepID=UPI003F7643A9